LKEEIVPKPRILLADDNNDVLVRVTKLLRADYDVLAAVRNGAAVLRDWSALRPDIIVLDISMGAPSGIEVAQQLRDSGCNSRIIFLTVHDDREFVAAAMGAGGSAYVVKSRVSRDLIPAITAVLSNRLFVSPSLMFPNTQ
jgi:DNA-binding NarL/FixJ family response regulator